VFDFPALVESLNKLVAFAERNTVTNVTGCHIEMTRTPKKDYPIKALYQPEEPPLEMTIYQLKNVQDTEVSILSKHGVHAFDDFIISNFPCHRALTIELIRGSLLNLKQRFVTG
jgi:hydroxyacylglutathione hydrolase